MRGRQLEPDYRQFEGLEEARRRTILDGLRVLLGVNPQKLATIAIALLVGLTIWREPNREVVVLVAIAVLFIWSIGFHRGPANEETYGATPTKPRRRAAAEPADEHSG